MNTDTGAAVPAVDDHELIRRGLSELTNGVADMQLCCEAGSATQAPPCLEGVPTPP